MTVSCTGNPLTAALCGYIFEPYAIEMLEKGGKFTHQKLERGNNQQESRDSKLTIQASKKIVVDRVLPGQRNNQLYVPKTKNFAAVDALIPGIGVFQMTVGKNHDIKINAQVLATFGKAKKFYWLLSPLYYCTFTKKTPQEIDQYAVMIPYPE